MLIDDILGYSRTPEEHAQHLCTTIEVLRKNELCAKLKKCEFWPEKIAFLGHIASKKGVLVDPTKIKVVTNWPTPKNATEMRNFLWLAGYHRRFVQDFLKIAMPLTNLT